MKFRKNKLGKIILILLMMFILTGCSVDYNVVVDEQKRVKETVKVIESNENILKNNDYIDLFLTEQINAFKKNPLYQNYVFNKKMGKKFSYVTLTRNYDSLKAYSESLTFNHLFEYAEITTNNGIVTFKTAGKYYYDNVFGENNPDPLFFIDNINIKMKFYNNIIDSNADEIDKKNNILIWNINADNKEKELYFKIGKDKRYDIIVLDYLYNNRINVIIIASAVIVGLLITFIIYKKIKKNNTV